MKSYKSGCLVCGKELKYLEAYQPLRCEICGLEFESNVTCVDNHYICDACHSKSGYFTITRYAGETKSKNPIEIATEMMKNEYIHMHGPEHHYLVVAALLAAYKNAGGEVDLDASLETAKARAKNVPGGICGMWGSCGAAIGTGIFMSIVTEATPLSVEEWSAANLMTSKSLYSVSQNGGPRCCKRNTYLSILTAVDFVKKYLKVEMDTTREVKCMFHGKNTTCRKEKCLFHGA